MPKFLIYLSCKDNLIEYLAELPQTLKYLNCSCNKIKKIKKINSNMRTLYCCNNKISYFPVIPKYINHFVYHDNCLITKNIKDVSFPSLYEICYNKIDKKINIGIERIDYQKYRNCDKCNKEKITRKTIIRQFNIWPTRYNLCWYCVRKD